jgi:predicted acylesterase/phospholipase RssA/CRP-like cAMP-binding protein
MYVIVRGRLQVFVADPESGPAGERMVAELSAGEPVGELQLLSGGGRTATVRAAEACELVRLTKNGFEEAAGKAPLLLQQMADLVRRRLRAYRLLSVLPRLFGSLDAALLEEMEGCLEWLHLGRGEILFHQGDPETGLCILLSGRLQAAVYQADGGVRIVGEVAPGETVGEMGLFTGEPRSAEVKAVRDSELVKLSPAAFRRLADRCPQAVMEISRIVIQRLRRNIRRQEAAGRSTSIALLPATADFPIQEFARSLVEALSSSCSVLHLSGSRLERMLATPGLAQTAPGAADSIRLEAWLDEQETRYEFLIYETDPRPTAWSHRCLRQADRVLIVARAEDGPRPGALERALLGGDVAARSLLVLTHRPEAALPSGTEAWLEARDVDGHLHLRRRQEDFQRLARLLSGKAVGLVLSGGGAKGFAHMGVLQALEEAGIPVDLIGGTSMGAVMGAGYAMGVSPREGVARSKDLFARHRPFKEYTLPLVSLLAGRRLNDLLQELYGDARLEDLWLNTFCISTNLTTAEACVHNRGPVWRAVRGSLAIPGMLEPVIAGENLLVDGGVVNNLPVDVMRRRCEGTVLAVNASPKKDVRLSSELACFPTAWQLLAARLNPFRKAVRVPGIFQVLGRTTMLGSVHHGEAVRDEADFWLDLPLDGFSMLDFAEIDRIVAAGYDYARIKIAAWEERPS